MSFEVKGSPDSQQEARVKAWSWGRKRMSQFTSSSNIRVVLRF